MMDFIFFLGRFHVLALHLPIGIIFAALWLEWFTRRQDRDHLRLIIPSVWALAALSAVLTVVLGYMHISEGGFTGPSATAHRWYGTSVAVVTVLVWLLSVRWKPLYHRSRPLTALVLLVLVTMTGHYGGNLTHGDTFLVEYAPEPIRSLAGLEPQRPPVENLAMADPYLDVIKPILDARCSSCHNDNKMNGQFDVSSYESTLEGGENGPAIVPGDPAQGEMFARLSLPHDHEDFMPADGKTPLTGQQIELVRWWIEAGTPQGVTFAESGLVDSISPGTEKLLMAELGLGEFGEGVVTAVAGNTPVKASPEIVENLYRQGFLVRQLSLSDAGLDVRVYSANTKLHLDQIQALIGAASHIVQLDLQGAGFSDNDVSGFGAFTALKKLQLDHNSITDLGVSVLASLPELEILNLYGNSGVSDTSVETLAAMENLQKVYLWQTAISDEGFTNLKARRPDLKIQTGTQEVLSLPLNQEQ